jgi:hypothetical protein
VSESQSEAARSEINHHQQNYSTLIRLLCAVCVLCAVCCVRVVEELKSDTGSVSMRIRPPLRSCCCVLPIYIITFCFLRFTPSLPHSLHYYRGNCIIIALHSLSCPLNRLLLDCTSATQGHSSHAALHAS